MWNHRICGINCPGSQLTCFKVLMQERRELGCYMKDVSWSQHIQADNKPSAKSVKSQSMLFRETWTTSNVWQEWLILHRSEASPGNDVLALWLIWSLVQFALKESKRRKGRRGTFWQLLKACKRMDLLVRAPTFPEHSQEFTFFICYTASLSKHAIPSTVHNPTHSWTEPQTRFFICHPAEVPHANKPVLISSKRNKLPNSWSDHEKPPICVLCAHSSLF